MNQEVPSAAEPMKKCQNCAEFVLLDAKVCRFCNRAFPSDGSSNIVALTVILIFIALLVVGALASSAPSAAAGVFGIGALLALIIIGGAFYFLPSIIAARHKKKNAAAIFILNLLTGWTFIGWVGALIWALVHENP